MSEVFSYGSLMLPTSLVARFSEVPSVSTLYENNVRYNDDEIIRDEALEIWKDVRDRIDIIPVKLRGFVRLYSLDSPRSGAMLEAVETNNKNQFINGYIISGLTDSEISEISSTEPGYCVRELDSEDFTSYGSRDVPDELSVTIYTQEKQTVLESMTSQWRNETYHDRILKGIDFLKDSYPSDVVQEFRTDFLKTTYEPPISGQNPSQENLTSRTICTRNQNRAVENFNEIFNRQQDDF